MNIHNILLQANPAQAPEVHQAAKEFGELDPIGIGMSAIAMGVVFLSLILLFLVFSNIAKIYSLDLRKKSLIKLGRIEEADKLPTQVTGEVAAAIALAMYKYKIHLHDLENFRLTINKVSRTYSPWSSKLYGLRQSPQKK